MRAEGHDMSVRGAHISLLLDTRQRAYQPLQKVREPPKPSATSNPSKRHRERLNGELETVAQLLPYDAATIGRLDKLSVLRLAVSYLQVKAHFHACLHNSSFLCPFPLSTHSYSFVPQPLPYHGVPTVFHSQTSQVLLDPNEADFETISMKIILANFSTGFVSGEFDGKCLCSKSLGTAASRAPQLL
uniref:BHLH domain-containing protein n=1 Tax=Heterorhabditis bacteriophora TaxID=37862 RepID=A0A1I7WVN6_HETBA